MPVLSKERSRERDKVTGLKQLRMLHISAHRRLLRPEVSDWGFDLFVNASRGPAPAGLPGTMLTVDVHVSSNYVHGDAVFYGRNGIDWRGVLIRLYASDVFDALFGDGERIHKSIEEMHHEVSRAVEARVSLGLLSDKAAQAVISALPTEEGCNWVQFLRAASAALYPYDKDVSWLWGQARVSPEWSPKAWAFWREQWAPMMAQIKESSL